MIYDRDCDLIREEKEDDCESCYRYEICKPFFGKKEAETAP